MYFGYSVTEEGTHMPKVELKTVEEIYNWVWVQAGLFPELKVTDIGDCLVLHIIDGNVVFPPVPAKEVEQV